jgi:hypothetical protein
VDSAVEYLAWCELGLGYGWPTLADVETLGIVAQAAWDEVKRAALALPDEGSGERYV